MPEKDEELFSHSKKIDKIIGLKVYRTEQKLLKKYRPFYKRLDDSNHKKHFSGAQTWIGLNPQVLQTPYCELINFLSILAPYGPKKIVDFGAGYGRLGIVLGAVMPETTYLGYEIVPGRCNEGKRIFEKLSLDSCLMIQDNILDDDFMFPKSDIFFIYDFSRPEDIIYVLRKILNNYRNEKFFIVAKGEEIRIIMKKSYPELCRSNKAIHDTNWSIYSTYCDVQLS